MDDVYVSIGTITFMICRHYADYTTLNKEVSIVAIHSVNMS
jgi:hypothetical protein